MLIYMVSDVLALSAIVTLLAAGICISHYAWYNLSHVAREVSSVAVETIGCAAESFVFVYIGLTTFSYNDWDWCIKFCVIEIFIVLIS